MTADTQAAEVRVYLPAPNAPALSHVLAGSAIVSRHQRAHRPDEPGGPARLLVHYEGNRYGAANMVTYADQAMLAYWRMRDHYPTVAQAAVLVEQLVRIGTLDAERGEIELVDAEHARDLAEWLGCSTERLRAELHVKGVRRL